MRNWPSASGSLKTRMRSLSRPFVVGGPLVRVVLDHPDAALLIDRQSRGRDDVRLPGDQFDDEPIIRHGRGCCSERGYEKKKTKYREET